MNILIPNSWLKDYLETDATPQEFATAMSLTSVSIEKIEKIGDDYIYDIEVTTNRPDLMSIHGIAREASAVLPQQGFKAVFKPKTIDYTEKVVSKSDMLNIVNDPTLVNRIVAVVMEIDLAPSPKLISDRLTKTGIRSINNAVDVTNYIMREVGHPSHVFDYDRLANHNLIIRRSKKGEKIVTLDDKEYELPGNDIVADDGTGRIVDLLGIMGTANSVVTDTTKRIVLFLDNNNVNLLRKTSMNLGIRTEAAVLNEKGINPDIMLPTLLTGIELLKKNANAKVISPIIDIYPNKVKAKTVIVSKDKITSLIGIEIPDNTIKRILTDLGFEVSHSNNTFTVEVFTSRINDIEIPEDIIEEVARVYGYHKIPNELPPAKNLEFYHQESDEFYWIRKIKEAFKYWGYTETYTYSMVSESVFEGPIEDAVPLKNPLSEDHAFLRKTLIPSLLEVARNNKESDGVKLFEIANIYIKKERGLPDERLHLAAILENNNFYLAKGLVEQVFFVLGITNYTFETRDDGVDGAFVKLAGKRVGHIEAIDLLALELDLVSILPHAASAKKYLEPAKFPPVVEDIRVKIAPDYSFGKIEKSLKEASELVEDVKLLDVYEDKKTFRITFRSNKRTLTNEDIAPVRESLISTLYSSFKAELA